MPQTVCLNMIVKDEASVIERCLASVKPFVTHWVIVDTGSTDGTQDIIRRFMADVPGTLHERPWRNFGHNRNEALELARGEADYLLMMDADNSFHAPAGWHWPALGAPGYYVQMDLSGTRYQQCLLISTALPWRWEGVLHEYLTAGAAKSRFASTRARSPSGSRSPSSNCMHSRKLSRCSPSQ